MITSNINFPYIGHPSIQSDPIIIKDELTYGIAKLIWGEIAAKWEKKEEKPALMIPTVLPGNVKTVELKAVDLQQVKEDGIKTEPRQTPEIPPKKYMGGDHGAPRWTDPEKEALDKHLDNFDEAFAAYLKVSPESTRTRDAVRQRWVIWAKKAKTLKEVKPEREQKKQGRYVVKKSGVLKGTKFKGNRYTNKWQIPFSSVTDKPKYDAAYGICCKFNLPYPEAIKRQEEDKTGVIQQGPAENVAERSEDTLNVSNVVNQSSEAITSSNEVKELDGNNVKTSSMADVSPLTIATGMKVRQITPDHGKTIFGVGTVVARERGGELISVRNGGGKIHKIDAKCLELVRVGEKKATEVEI